MLLYEGGEGGTIAPHGLYRVADATVPDGWLTTVAAMVAFAGIFMPPSFYRDGTGNKSAGCLFPCLQGKADALPSMAITV
jgi:hypothetical protein